MGRRSHSWHAVLAIGSFLCAFTTSSSAQFSGACATWRRPLQLPNGDCFSIAAAFDSQRDVTVIVTSHPGTGGAGTTWEYDGARLRVVSLEGPARRVGAAMAFDSARGVTVLFGGEDEFFNRLGDTWEWNGNGWAQRQVTGPEPRSFAAMVYDAARGECVLHGAAAIRQFPETWAYDGLAWRKVSEVGPGTRYAGAMAYDAAREVVVLFSGNFFGESDTWEWNGVEWMLVSETGPPGRHVFGMTYHASQGQTLIYSGRYGNNEPRDDCWSWNGESWLQLPSDPGRREGQVMVYDDRRDRTVMLGGDSRCEIWELELKMFGLSVTSSCPESGPIRIEMNCAGARAELALLHSAAIGQFTVPSGAPCSGTTIGLDRNSTRVVWRGRAHDEGRRILEANASKSVCGSYVQALNISACRTSAVVRVE